MAYQDTALHISVPGRGIVTGAVTGIGFQGGRLVAVAGGTASSIHVVFEDGWLVEHAVMHRTRYLLAHDVDEALAALGEAGGRGI